MEIGYASCCGPRSHRRHEALPELRIDVLCRIDAKAVDAIAVDPIAEYLYETTHRARVFGHEIVEAGEITHRGTLAAKIRVAAIVIINRIVQPLRNFGVLLSCGHEGRVGVVGARE